MEEFAKRDGNAVCYEIACDGREQKDMTTACAMNRYAIGWPHGKTGRDENDMRYETPCDGS